MIKKQLFNLWVIFRGSVSFLIFAITSQFFTLLIVLPFSTKRSNTNLFYARLLRNFTVFWNITNFNMRFKHINRRKNIFDTPSLIVCNHQSVLDATVAIAFTSKMCVINNNWHNNAWARFFILKYIRFYPIDMEKDALVEALQPSIAAGFPVLIFPEGVMNTKENIGRFHKGGFYLASKLQIDIQPVVIHYSKNVFSWKWYFMKNGKVTIKYLDRVKFGSKEYGDSYQELTKNVSTIMRAEYISLATEAEKQNELTTKNKN